MNNEVDLTRLKNYTLYKSVIFLQQLRLKKRLSRGFHSLYVISSYFVLVVLSDFVLVLHSKCRKQRKERSHAQYYVTHRIKIFHQFFEHLPILMSTEFVYQRVPLETGGRFLNGNVFFCFSWIGSFNGD